MLTNAYCTLADYKNYVVARGQSSSTDATDDGVIQDLINSASRYIDTQSGRQFYPRIEEQLYNIPSDRHLYLDDDLLAVITFSNGDDAAISANQYVTQGAKPPFWAISLRKTSTVTWEPNSAGDSEQVIGVLGIWGRHDNYTQRAWLKVGTLGAAMSDTTTLAFTMTAGHSIAVGNILRIDNELFNVSTVATNTITPIVRGDNGSTAATHLISAPVYAWQPMEGAKQSALEIVNSAYKKRFGQSVGESATVTAAGVVLSPRDIPATAQAFIDSQAFLV